MVRGCGWRKVSRGFIHICLITVQRVAVLRLRSSCGRCCGVCVGNGVAGCGGADGNSNVMVMVLRCCGAGCDVYEKCPGDFTNLIFSGCETIQVDIYTPPPDAFLKKIKLLDRVHDLRACPFFDFFV